MEVIKAGNLIKNYRNTKVLRNINLEVREGEFIGIMGKSGSGKTTLLKTLGMIEPISDGKLFYKHHEINKISDKEASRIRREELGFIFQEFFLMPSLNAIENVMLPLFLSKSANDNGKSKAKELMKNFEVDALADKTPDELSGGERQRIAICRALINNPQIIFADEPTGNLDSKSGQIVIKALQEINSELSKTVIMVTHDPQMASYCERIVLLKDGEVLDQLNKTNAQDEFYKQIIESMIKL